MSEKKIKKKIKKSKVTHKRAKKVSKKQRKRFLFKDLFLSKKFCVFTIAIIMTIVSLTVYDLLLRPAVHESREYVVKQGVSIASVASDLKLNSDFKILVKLFGNKVMAGTYDFPKDVSVWRIARMLAKGKIATVSVTIPEGFTIKQIINFLKNEKFLTGKIINTYRDGELFPDTYIVAKGTNRQMVLDMMAKKMIEIRGMLEKTTIGFPSPLKNWNDVIILASIVQKETALTKEMPVVASVYLNRLRKKMRLQACPTVVYVVTNGLGDMQEKRLWKKYLQIKNPYNTYKNIGLPPAPIANVGIDAIYAVLNPENTNYYYFVADGKGGHVFSSTLDEHNNMRNVWKKIRLKEQSVKK